MTTYRIISEVTVPGTLRDGEEAAIRHMLKVTPMYLRVKERRGLVERRATLVGIEEVP